jgi:Zn-dependent protease
MPTAALSSSLAAIVILAILAIELNLTLFFFNLFPVPPLDGSRIVRNLLPYNAMRAYDNISGIASWFVMIAMGWFLLPLLMRPALGVIFGILSSLPGK